MAIWNIPSCLGKFCWKVDIPINGKFKKNKNNCNTVRERNTLRQKDATLENLLGQAEKLAFVQCFPGKLLESRASDLEVILLRGKGQNQCFLFCTGRDFMGAILDPRCIAMFPLLHGLWCLSCGTSPELWTKLQRLQLCRQRYQEIAAESC